MSTKNGRNRQNEESFRQATTERPSETGSGRDTAAAEFGVDPADLRAWKRKLASRGKQVKTLRGMAQLRAENEALRNQIVNLQGQWEVLKSTLGVLSTTVCSHEMF